MLAIAPAVLPEPGPAAARAVGCRTAPINERHIFEGEVNRRGNQMYLDGRGGIATALPLYGGAP